MTEFQGERERSRDLQDSVERHVFGEIEHRDGKGSIIRVRGTDTEDQEAVVMSIGGVGINLPKNTDAEVVLLSLGSDTNLKFALTLIPRDKQRQWKEGTGGVQHPTDPDFAFEFNGKRAHLTKGEFAVGDGTLEVSGGNVVVRGDLTVTGSVTAQELHAPHAPDVLPGAPVDGGFDA